MVAEKGKKSCPLPAIPTGRRQRTFSAGVVPAVPLGSAQLAFHPDPTDWGKEKPDFEERDRIIGLSREGFFFPKNLRPPIRHYRRPPTEERRGKGPMTE